MSFTRKMARLLKDSIKSRSVKIVDRDVAARPPCLIDAAWISAEQTPEELRTPQQMERLLESDQLVAEVLVSDVIVIGCPTYNFGIPAPLKAWIDNIVRKGKTYTVDEKRKPRIVYGLLHAKKIILLVSSGKCGYQTGGNRAALNHADTAVGAVFEQLGVRNIAKIVLEGSTDEDPALFDQSWQNIEEQVRQTSHDLKMRWR